MTETGKELSDFVKELAKPKIGEELILMGAEILHYNGEPIYATIKEDNYIATFAYHPNGWYHLHDYQSSVASHCGLDLDENP